MKKIILILCFSLLFVPFSALAMEVTPKGKRAVLIDYNSGKVLYDKNMNEKVNVASLTKMMGLILIFEKIDNGSIKVNEKLTVSRTAMDMGGTQLWLEEGEKITIDDLLKGITMASANDAMVLMAERVSGSEKAFVKEMNKKAKSLGLKNTHFVNVCGFDEDGHFSSAYDMALIAKELLKHDKVLSYTGKYEDYIKENTKDKSWIVNTNKLVKFYPGVDGLKTGFTDKSGSTIAVTSLKNNLRLIAVLLGYNNTKERNKEAVDLLDYGYSRYKNNVIFKKGKVMKEVKVPKSLNEKIKLTLKDDVKVLSKKEEKLKKYNYKIKTYNIKLPIKRGDTVGSLDLISDKKIISKTPLIANKDVKKPNFIKGYLKVLSDFLGGA